MPKNETYPGAKRCFRVTGSGKIMRERTGAHYLLEHKSNRKTHRLATDQILENADVKRVKRLLGK